MACVASEDEFYAGLDVPAWARSVVVDAYNKMQAEVAEEVRSGRRDEALGKLRAFRDAAASINARVQSPAVAEQLFDADKLEREVAAAFEGPNQPERQNDFSKAKGAAAVDGRRTGSKK